VSLRFKAKPAGISDILSKLQEALWLFLIFSSASYTGWGRMFNILF